MPVLVTKCGTKRKPNFVIECAERPEADIKQSPVFCLFWRFRTRFLLSGYDAHRESEPNQGADHESLGFRRLWSCFLELKSLLFIPAVLRRTKREL